jgi:hypothetical protein
MIDAIDLPLTLNKIKTESVICDTCCEMLSTAVTQKTQLSHKTEMERNGMAASVDHVEKRMREEVMVMRL